MKYLILFLLTIVGKTVSAQITLEHTYPKDAYVTVVNIEGEGNKYMMVDTLTKNIEIYNDNHTLWKTIIPYLPTGTTFSTLHWVAKKLVDFDNNLEVAYSYFSPITSTWGYTTIILKEDGTILKTLPDVYTTQPVNVNGDWKILAYHYNFVAIVDVYSVPGKYLNIVKPGGMGNVETSSLLFPNPMEASATIRYSLPNGIHNADLLVYDMNGKMVRSFKVTNQFSEIFLSRQELSSGMYTYKLSFENKELSTERFIIR